MRPFAFTAADSADAALRLASRAPSPSDLPATEASAQYLAGGTTLLDLMKLDVMRPETLIDIAGLRRDNARIVAGADGLSLGAMVSMAEAAEHPAVLRDYPVIADTLKLAASAQLRNMASLGGNVLQRTRCAYFRDTRWDACNKRSPGSGCAALDGVNRQHAVLGASDACIATYPGDFAQALVALGARIETTSRRIDFGELHRRPGTTPNVETLLRPGELVTAIVVPAGPWTRRSRYVKVRDRQSYQFALAAAAVALDMSGDTVREARIGLGGVATVPWRSREAEAALRGKPLDEASATAAAEAAFAGAQPRKHNAYKVALGKSTLVRALLETRQMRVA